MAQDQSAFRPSPDSGMNLQDASVVVDLFARATEASLNCPLRKGATVHLPAEGELLMTGDLHDNGLNFQRIVRFAALHQRPGRHLILHELIHGQPRIMGRDMSIRMAARVAALKVAFPDQVHLLLANHELAQLAGEGIMKDGVSLIDAFEDGIDFIYADDADRVREAFGQFIRSMLLAVRCPKGIFCSHSLPSPQKLEYFDTQVIDRALTDQDFKSDGSAYAMVWGRNHSNALAQTLAERWGTRLFIMGHQPADMGYEVEGDNMLVLASDHTHGVILPIDLSRDYTLNDLVGEMVPLASIVM